MADVVRETERKRLSGASPAGEVVLAYVRDQVAAISRYDPLVRRDEPDAVHQMRVATRRARSALQAFGAVIEREATRPLCAELKWLAAVLGQARDGEVMQDRLTAGLAAVPPALAAGPVKARITAYFTAELAQAHQRPSGICVRPIRPSGTSSPGACSRWPPNASRTPGPV